MSRRQQKRKQSNNAKQSSFNDRATIPVVTPVAPVVPPLQPRMIPVVTPVAASPANMAVPVASFVAVAQPDKAPESQRRPRVRKHVEQAPPIIVPPEALPQPVVPARAREQQSSTPSVRRVREPLRWSFTYADVAAAAGISVDRVRHASARIGGREPALVMTDLRSVSLFIFERRARANQQRAA